MNDADGPDNSNEINDIHLAEVINMMTEACIDYPEMPFDLNIFFEEVKQKIDNDVISKATIEEYISKYPGGKSSENITHFWQVKSLTTLLAAFKKMETYHIEFDVILKLLEESEEDAE